MSDHDQLVPESAPGFTAADAAKEINEAYCDPKYHAEGALKYIIQKALDAALGKAVSDDERHKEVFGYGLKRAKGGD